MAKIHAAKPRRQPSMLTCRQVTALVMAYLSGELDLETRSTFESHLGGCQDCRAFLTTYKQSVDATHILGYDDMPADLQERALATVRQKLKKQPRQR